VAGRARLGIDFGTANTVAVIVLPGREPRPLLFDGSPQLPSALCADPSGRLLVGQDAIHTATAEPASFEPHPKRCIDHGSVLLGDRAVPVTELIAAVLGQVAIEAKRVAGASPADVTLTYPASWGASRRGTLLSAATVTWPTVRLVPEPVAAAHHFVADTDALPVGGTALVYDFGAGTFDASVVRRTGTGFEILSAVGLADCGGLDVDAAIVNYLGTALSERDPAAWARLMSPEASTDRRASRQLWDNVHTAKQMLSRATSTLVHVPLLDVEAPLGRDQLDELAGPILDRTVTAARAALADADIQAADLSAVFLAGGSSRMPAVASLLHRELGRAPTIVDQPELATAEGSVQATAGGAVTAPADPDVTALDPSWPVGAAVPAAPDSASGSRRGLRRTATVAGTALAVFAAAAVLAVQLWPDPDGEAVAEPTPSPTVTPATSPTPSYPPGIDPCLLGSWKRVHSRKNNIIAGKSVQFTGSGGQTDTYRPDGVLAIRFDSTTTARVSGATWQNITRGTATVRYKADAGRLLYSQAKASGTWKMTRNGRYNVGGKLELSLEPEEYACTGDTLTVSASFFTSEYVRVTPTPTPSS
jgi:molecular chaperone DnaK